MDDRCRVGWVLVDLAGWARLTRAPTVGSRRAEASFVTCFGVRRFLRGGTRRPS